MTYDPEKSWNQSAARKALDLLPKHPTRIGAVLEACEQLAHEAEGLELEPWEVLAELCDMEARP